MPNREIMPENGHSPRAFNGRCSPTLHGVVFGKTGPTPSQDWAVNAPGYSNLLALA